MWKKFLPISILEEIAWKLGFGIYTEVMATTQSTADYLADQVAGAGDIRTKKMFGEYALYCDGKVVALICDEQLFLKPTDAGRGFIGDVEESPPYPGAKNYFRIDEARWDDREWMTQLIAKTAAETPKPKPKKAR